MPLLSVVIPSYNDKGKLSVILREFNRQSLGREHFSVTVIDDCSTDGTMAYISRNVVPDLQYQFQILQTEKNSGPATARNLGSKHAEGDILLFLGSDCFSSPHLFFYHLYEYKRRKEWPMAVQGLTLWHPEVHDDFADFLYQSGLQVNVQALKEPDGSWKKEVPGWGLTTNFSVSKDVFEAEGGYNEEFPYAAWEDVSLASNFIKRSLKTFFAPLALNFHHHRQTLDGYIQRQIREGKSRLILCKIHPEAAGDMIDSQALREYKEDMLATAYRLAKEAEHLTGDDAKPVKYQRWAIVLRLASIKGTLDGIAERGHIWKSLPHVHTAEIIRHMCGAASSFERGDYAMCSTELEWASQKNKNNWAILCGKAEVELAIGNKVESIALFVEALEQGPGAEWPRERLKELVGG